MIATAPTSRGARGERARHRRRLLRAGLLRAVRAALARRRARRDRRADRATRRRRTSPARCWRRPRGRPARCSTRCARPPGVACDELKVDGGMTVNELLMQFQADVLGVPSVRPRGGRDDGARRRLRGRASPSACGRSPDDVRANWHEARPLGAAHGPRRGRAPLRALARGGRALAGWAALTGAGRFPIRGPPGSRERRAAERRRPSARTRSRRKEQPCSPSPTHAAEAIRGIVAAPELPDGAGLRIATQPRRRAGRARGDRRRGPAESDQVVDEDGARVFVEDRGVSCWTTSCSTRRSTARAWASR